MVEGKVLMKDRVMYFGKGDLSYGCQMGRIEELLQGGAFEEFRSIRDAIEARQCFLILNNALTEEAKAAEPYGRWLSAAKDANRKAFQYVHACLGQATISEVCSTLEWDYQEALLEMLAAGKLDEAVSEDDFLLLLNQFPHLTSSALRHKRLVEKYDPQIRSALLANTSLAAKLIIDTKACVDERRRKTYLPKSLTAVDVNTVFRNYVNSDEANPNYLDVISRWRGEWGVAIEGEIRAVASKKHQQSMDEVFDEGGGTVFRYGVGICYDPEQTVCVIASAENETPVFRYSAKWILEQCDNPTLLNTLIYVFGFADLGGLLSVSIPGSSRNSLMDLVGVKTKSEYRGGLSLTINEMRELGTIRGCMDVLNSSGKDLESVIEWYFNSYLVDEYSFEGFSVALERDGSLLSRCRSAAPELEAILRVCQLEASGREVSDETLRYETFSSFHQIRSKVARKYVYGAGEEFRIACRVLFSDQCMLSYSPAEDKSWGNFFYRVVYSGVKRAEVPEHDKRELEWLLEHDFVVEDIETGDVRLTLKAVASYRVWKNGCLAYHHEQEDIKRAADELIDDGFFVEESTLLSRREADYFSFVFHDRDYDNAMALRNRYLHGEIIAKDPDDEVHRINYERIIHLFLLLIIKIEDELSLRYGEGPGVEWVDWPLQEVDESFIERFGKGE